MGGTAALNCTDHSQMEEFAVRMRDELQLRMPVLSQRVKPPGVSQATPLDQWLHDIDNEVADMDQPAHLV